MDRVYNNKGDIALVTVFIDAGATGGDYKYIIKKEYFGGLICLDQTIRLSNDSLQVYWVNTDTCIIDGILYNIWLP